MDNIPMKCEHEFAVHKIEEVKITYEKGLVCKVKIAYVFCKKCGLVKQQNI